MVDYRRSFYPFSNRYTASQVLPECFSKRFWGKGMIEKKAPSRLTIFRHAALLAYQQNLHSQQVDILQGISLSYANSTAEFGVLEK
jgi:hypothetical protein